MRESVSGEIDKPQYTPNAQKMPQILTDHSSGSPGSLEAWVLIQHLRPPQMASASSHLVSISKHHSQEVFSRNLSPTSTTGHRMANEGYLKDTGCYQGLEFLLSLTYLHTIHSIRNPGFTRTTSLNSCYRHHEASPRKYRYLLQAQVTKLRLWRAQLGRNPPAQHRESPSQAPTHDLAPPT